MAVALCDRSFSNSSTLWVHEHGVSDCLHNKMYYQIIIILVIKLRSNYRGPAI